MKKIIFILTVMIFIIINQNIDLYAQKQIENNGDTLIIGGVYKITLIDGSKITGEYSGTENSELIFMGKVKVYRLKNDQIKNIGIAVLEPAERKFRFLSSAQLGVSIPSGNFGDIHKPGICYAMSADYLFNRYIGLGAELQFNNFPGTELNYSEYNYYNNSYIYDSKQTSDYKLYVVKLNLVVGNFFPENKIVFYGLGGVAFQFNSPHGTMGTSYGAGLGAFYKISKQFGINGEFQYNKLADEESVNYYYSSYNSNYSENTSGSYYIRFGVMYTVF